jgi:hypothetical protein
MTIVNVNHWLRCVLERRLLVHRAFSPAQLLMFVNFANRVH